MPSLHHNAVKALQSEYPVYGEAVQLMRLWLSKHWMTGHLCHEAIELLVASTFLTVSGNTHSLSSSQSAAVVSAAPTTAFSAFIRTLEVLSTFDWEGDPFIVDFGRERVASLTPGAVTTVEQGSEMTADVRASIALRFRAMRSAAEKEQDAHPHRPPLPVSVNPPMYLVSSCDKVLGFEPALADKSPERVVLGMLVSASKATLKRVRRWLVSPDVCLSEYLAEREDVNVEGEREAALYSDAIVHTVFHSEAVKRRCDLSLSFHKGVTNAHPDKGPVFARLPVFANMTNKELLVSNIVVM